MINIISKLILFIFSIFSTYCFSQQKMDDYFDHLFLNKKLMGSVAVSYKDSIIYKKSVGFANAETLRKNTSETKFRVGSITKTYTAALVLKAIEEKKLNLNTKLSSYYPQVKNADKITIKELLNHRSGIVNFTEIDGENQWEKSFHTQREFIGFFINQPSDFDPDTNYKYSNTNYALLGFILEKIYTKTFAEILDEKIVKPLHLKNTYYSTETDETKNEALSYNIQNQYVRNAITNFSNHPASGGIVSTPTEVNQFISALFTEKIISKKSLEKLLPKKGGEYGFGITKLAFDDIEGYYHSGRIENYISDYWYFPQQQLGLVSLTNAVNIDTDYIMKILLAFAYGKTPTLTNFNIIDGLSEADFTNIAGTYKRNNTKETVTISSNGKNLVFQASESGQDSVEFDYKGNNTYEYANIKLVFGPEKGELYFEQDEIKEVLIK